MWQRHCERDRADLCVCACVCLLRYCLHACWPTPSSVPQARCHERLGESAGVEEQCTVVLELEKQGEGKGPSEGAGAGSALKPKYGTSARFMRGKARLRQAPLESATVEAALDDLMEAKERQEHERQEQDGATGTAAADKAVLNAIDYARKLRQKMRR